jgi:hypothetical protein
MFRDQHLRVGVQAHISSDKYLDAKSRNRLRQSSSNPEFKAHNTRAFKIMGLPFQLLGAANQELAVALAPGRFKGESSTR